MLSKQQFRRCASDAIWKIWLKGYHGASYLAKFIFLQGVRSNKVQRSLAPRAELGFNSTRGQHAVAQMLLLDNISSSLQIVWQRHAIACLIS